jgi:hypothetical protein
MSEAVRRRASLRRVRKRAAVWLDSSHLARSQHGCTERSVTTRTTTWKSSFGCRTNTDIDNYTGRTVEEIDKMVLVEGRAIA